MSNSPADSDPRAAADAAQVSTSDSPADVGPQQDPVTTPDDAEPATGTEPVADTEPETDESATSAEPTADEDATDAEPATGTEPVADTEPETDESATSAEPTADESATDAETPVDEGTTDAAAPASAPVPQDPAAPAAPVPTAPGSPPPSTGDRPAPATPIPTATASMGPVPAPPAAPVPAPPAPVATGPFPAGPVPTAPMPTGPVPTGPLPISPFPTGPAPTGSLPVTPFPTGPVPVSSASTGSIPVVPAHIGPAPAGAGPAGPFPTAPVPAPPAAPVPPPPAVTASPRTLQAAAPAGDAPQWSRGQWWTVLVLGVLAAIMGAAALVLRYLDVLQDSIRWDNAEEWWIFIDVSTFFLLSPLALTIVGIVQTCRKAAPSAFVAATALAPAFISTLFYHFWRSNIIANILHVVAIIITLMAACMCLWGRLPHRTRTPRSAVAASALAMAATWSMGTKLLIMWVGDYGYTYYHYNYIHIYTVWSWIAVAIRAATLVCGIALLALMIFHRKVIIMRILTVALGAFTVAGTGFGVMFGFYGRGLDMPVFSIPSAVLLIALAVPVFCASFRQWCAGTWTAPAWKPSAVAGRPTTLARTSQVTDPGGNTLNDADIAAMLPTTRPTFWVSLFFGLFGLLPMLTANSTARSLGVVTNAYNSAMIKGFVLGILMWTAITAASYTIILFELL